MSKNWTQRIRDIAENRPEKLHPMLRGMTANPRRGEAWDRVSWQAEGDGEIAASAAVRPIIAMLQWLDSRSLLSSQGKAILKSIDRMDPTNVSLTRDLVKPAAWAFLDAEYRHWYDTCAINYAMDESFPIGDHSELDALWAEFKPRTPKRRWFQFSLRTVLLVITLCAVALWLWTRYVAAYRARARAVAALRELGGTVTVEPAGPAWLCKLVGEEYFVDAVNCDLRVDWWGGVGPITDAQLQHVKLLSDLRHLDLYGTQVTDAGLEQLQVLTQLRYLGLGNTEITDAGLESLEGLTNLEELDVRGIQLVNVGGGEYARVSMFNVQTHTLIESHVTDAGLEHLEELNHLRRLYLAGTKVTDAGMKYLQGLSRLERLDLGCTRVTDDGLEHIEHLANLEELYLDATQVTDGGLDSLRGLTNLKKLDLAATQVTNSGVADLQKALPMATIHR